MKTRGKVKGDTWNVGYSKEGGDDRDLLDDGADTNGYAEEKNDDVIPARGETRWTRSTRGGGNKRPGRMPRIGGPKGRSDKNSVDPAEFKEVVQGFFEFIEELNKAGRKKPDKRKVPADTKVIRQGEEPKPRKVIKNDAEPTTAQSSEKFELQPDTFAASKIDKNVYRYKDEDISTGKELLNLLKDQTKEPATMFPGNLAQAQAQEAKAQRETENARRETQPMMDFNPKYPHLQQFPGGNVQSYTNPLLMKQQQATKQQQQQQQQQAPNIYGNFDFPNNPMYADAVQRLRMQQQQAFDKNPMSNYFMPPYDNYQKMFHNELLNLQLLELLQKPMGSVPPHGAAALFENLSREFSVMNPMELAGQRYPNQSIGMELIRDGSTNVMNPKALEGKLGRAATHVAIAYFIYFKSLDPDTIAKSDKSKMDPTYNARMLKEKKHDTYPTDSLETYLAQNLAKMNNNPFDYLGSVGTAGLQRLMAQGNPPDQLRELQMQRMQQEAMLRNEELMQLRNAATYQTQAATKNEAKMEEENKAQKRRQEENRGRPQQQQQQVKTQPKEEEIIEIKENSEGEQEASKQPPKIEQKNKANEQGKTEDNPISADDIVEEITELTGPGQDKKGAPPKKNSTSPAPANKPTGNKETSEISKTEGQEGVVQKTSEVNEEASAAQTATVEKAATQPDQAKSSEVVAIEESPAQEGAQTEKVQPVEAAPQKDEKQ